MWAIEIKDKIIKKDKKIQKDYERNFFQYESQEPGDTRGNGKVRTVGLPKAFVCFCVCSCVCLLS